jgi:hypothetical protein
LGKQSKETKRDLQSAAAYTFTEKKKKKIIFTLLICYELTIFTCKTSSIRYQKIFKHELVFIFILNTTFSLLLLAIMAVSFSLAG